MMIERYLNRAKGYHYEDEEIFIFDYSELKKPIKLIVTAIYLDTSKQTNPSEKLEHCVKHTLNFPVPKGEGKKEKDIRVTLKIGSKELWKMRFEVTKCTKCKIGLSFD